MSESLFPWTDTVRAGFLDHAAANPWRLTLTTTWPRAIFQSLFFTLLGGVAYGPGGADFAFVGATGLVIGLSTLVGIADVPSTDKWMATTYRIRLGRLPALGVVAARSVPWLLEGLAAAIASTMVVGLATGRTDTAATIVSALPILLVMAVASGAAGLTAAAVSAFRDAEVLVGNAFMYLVIAAGGVLVPAGRLPWLDAIGTILPITHGLQALRSYADGRAWLAQLGAEALVGVGWSVAAWAAYGHQARRARRDDRDASA